uniref:Hsp20/alpha crystallin family protein n=1 Tax=Haemonchus placei TaxID=6290 RepID=A0A0N4WTU4_HAEPC
LAISLDVSKFKPDELKVNIDGRTLTVEGKQEVKEDSSYTSRSFLRQWTVPEDVDVEQIRSTLTEDGHLAIEVPKPKPAITSRNIPIQKAIDRTPLKDQFQLQMVDDDKKFAVSLDVSQFRPEELNVHLEGRELTIEGKQECKTENSAMHRSFTRKWLLPENVDLEAIRTQLDDKGHLSVEAPKSIEGHKQKRTIPIMAAPQKK